MVGGWPHLFLSAPLCLKGCQQLLLMPGGRGLLPPSPTWMCGRNRRCSLSTGVAGLECVTWGGSPGTARLLFCAGVLPSLSSCTGRQLSPSQGSGKVNGGGVRVGECMCVQWGRGEGVGRNGVSASQALQSKLKVGLSGETLLAF